jgi:hypothetical protein
MLEQQKRQQMPNSTYLSPYGSADSNNSISSSVSSDRSSLDQSLIVGGRVRQMFEERRRNGGAPLPIPAGWDNANTLLSGASTGTSKSDPLADRRYNGKVPRSRAPPGREQTNIRKAQSTFSLPKHIVEHQPQQKKGLPPQNRKYRSSSQPPARYVFLH